MAVAQAVLQGLGYTGTHLWVVRPETAAALDAGLQSLSATRQRVPAVAARGLPPCRKNAARWTWRA